MVEFFLGLTVGFILAALVLPYRVKTLVEHYQQKISDRPDKPLLSETMCGCTHGKHTHRDGVGSCRVALRSKTATQSELACACQLFVGKEL